jgi:bifunctional non-homologous end joining protein LigD
VGREQIINVGRYEVEITRPAKVLFPEDGITKGDLIEYYGRVAPWILLHLRGRPLALERYPDGIDNAREADARDDARRERTSGIS